VIDGRVPDFVRVVVAVDPSGSDDEDNADNDEIGIVIVGLGTDGNAYLLEDCTVKAGPATWGRVATDGYDRHAADLIVGETNFGGAMVKFVIQTARPKTPFRMVTASRGKACSARAGVGPLRAGQGAARGRVPRAGGRARRLLDGGLHRRQEPEPRGCVDLGRDGDLPGIVKAREEPQEEEPQHQAGSWQSF
jgi:phage terminase large subunit-like protein